MPEISFAGLVVRLLWVTPVALLSKAASTLLTMAAQDKLTLGYENQEEDLR